VTDLDYVEGDTVEVTVGMPAHGGHCVARIGGEHGRVVFVRHALPGERVTAEVTELHKGYLRADAIEIHQASPDRVTPPCPYAHARGCGGCDLQHVSEDAQLVWKATVVREQLVRMAGLSPDQVEELGVRVERLPGGLLGWRSRVRYSVDALGRPGLLQHRSHQVVAIDRCRIAHPDLQALDITSHVWPDADAIEVVASSGGDVSVRTRPAGELLQGPPEVLEVAAGREWHVPADGFWQVHPAAADTLVAAVLDMLQPTPGETAWDLYGGAGLFAAALAGRTKSQVTVVESANAGVASARANLADLAGVEVVQAKVEVALARRRVTGPVDLVVLDPPRTGAGRKVVRAITAAGPRAVAYVACDPVALARDIATFTAEGWRLAEIRGYDCFPMTQHIECVALLLPPAA
jgi:tRNA/tmRNA/rRNA uracil-C5-methylase (TrmA/RlmC/RlmD family)